MPYEGAGFLLSYKENILLGQRIKKAEDLAKDPTPEIEYFGGKIDQEDKNDPYATAFNELVEEVGIPILDAFWKQRVVPVHIFQPFSKKWIWCFRLELTDQEYARFVAANDALKHWPVDETKNFAPITGRTTSVRKSITTFVSVPLQTFRAYIAKFTATVQKSKNRLTDAKEYRSKETLHAVQLSDSNAKLDIALRAFNIVIFEEHFQ